MKSAFAFRAAIAAASLGLSALPASAYEVIQAPQPLSLAPHGQATVIAECPLGESVISGGYNIDGNASHVLVTASHPYTANAVLWSGWRVLVTAIGRGGPVFTLTVYAVCQ